MRIAVYHNQPSGGARRGLHGFCRALGRRHRIDVFTLTSADQQMLRDEDFATSVTRYPFAFRPPVRRGLYVNDVRRRQSYRDLQAVNLRAANEIDAGSYDVVLVDACRFTFAPTLLAALQTPSAYYFHHRPRLLSESTMPPPMSLYERFRGSYRLPIEQALARRLWRQDVAMVRAASAVVTNSRFTQGRIQRVYEIEATVAPYGVDLPQMPGTASGDYVLSVGELERRKGFDLIVEALGRLPGRRRPPLHIVANAGHPRVRATLEEQARQLGVALTILVLPPQEVLAREYRESMLFAYGAHEEALGLAPLEALSYGIPVVAVGEGGVLETVEHDRTGFFTVRDPGAFSQSLADLIGNPSLRAQFGQVGRDTVAERWRWDDRAASLEGVLARLAERRSAA